jgi:putative flippase GtrA
VTVARRLYERFQQLIHEFAKFGVIGVIGLIITNAVYDVLYNHLGFGPVTSTTIATVIAAMATYLGNRYWSFKHRERTGVLREGIIFCVLNGIGLLIQDAAVAFNYYVLGLGNNKVAGFIALNFGIGIATLFRFWSYRQFVWVSPTPSEPPAPVGQPPQPVPPVQAGQAVAPGQAAAPGQGGVPTPVASANGFTRRVNGGGRHAMPNQARSPFRS